MRFPTAVATLALLIAGSAHANVFNAKALARYDISYQKCEAQIPQMQGQRDPSYLGLYRIKADPTSLARLDKLRHGAEYAAEKKRASAVAPLSPASAASAASKLKGECAALWSDRTKARR